MTSPHYLTRYPTVASFPAELDEHDAYFEALAAEPLGVIGAEAVAESVKRETFPLALLGWLSVITAALGVVSFLALIVSLQK